MALKTINIGPAPTDERCAQAGQQDYAARSRNECRAYRRMLKRLFPIHDGTILAYLGVDQSSHDFGNCREVCVRYDGNDPKAVQHAFQIEAQSPAHWDDIARYELLWLERRDQLLEACSPAGIAEELPVSVQFNDIPEMPGNVPLAELLGRYPLPGPPDQKQG
jgi:hypothetical protein